MNKMDKPLLSWERTLGQPIRRLLATHDGTEGAVYARFGIEFRSGEILNIDCPENPYFTDKTTVEPNVLNDWDRSGVPRKSYIGRSLKNLIYFSENWGEQHRRHYFAVLDTGDYLTSYQAFNHTEFAFAPFRVWHEGGQCNLSWGPLELRSMRFFNAWNHTEMNPFALYK